jgi:hypothetical protein
LTLSLTQEGEATSAYRGVILAWPFDEENYENHQHLLSFSLET